MATTSHLYWALGACLCSGGAVTGSACARDIAAADGVIQRSRIDLTIVGVGAGVAGIPCVAKGSVAGAFAIAIDAIVAGTMLETAAGVVANPT